MTDASRVVGLSIGVSIYEDAKLPACPAAAQSAKELAAALDPKLWFDTRVVSNPSTIDEIFVPLQKAIHDARGGTFLLYYAGHALRRGEDLLLTVGETEVEGTRVCVPWSDVEDLLARERVKRAAVILNVDHAPADAGKGPTVTGQHFVMGSGRARSASADAQLRAYADVVLDGLRKPAAELAPYLDAGQLDVGGLGRYVFAFAPEALGAEVWSASDASPVLRSLAAELEETKDLVATAPQPEVKPALEPSEPEEEVRKPEPAAEPAPAAPLAKPGGGSSLGYLLIALAIAAAIAWYALGR